MEKNLHDLTRKYFLRINTHRNEDTNEEEWLDLVTPEKFWDTILDFFLDIESLKEYFNSKSIEEREEYFKFGIVCLQYFVQRNFTGPPLPKNLDEFLNLEKVKNIDFTLHLSQNGDEINVNMKHAALLVISKIIFDCCWIDDLVNLWWSCRALIIHQSILDELSPILLSNANQLYKCIQAVPVKGVIKAELYLEVAHMYLKFRHVSKSKDLLTAAAEILGLEYNLIGKLGRRTKYQTQELAQLSVKVILTKNEGISRPEIDDLDIPQNFSLNDDVRLDQVSFSEKSESTTLPNLEQKLLLAMVEQSLISSPADELQTEEILPFIDLILNQKNTYTVRVMTLLLRCKLECKNRRTIERCLKQCEDLISCFDKDKPSAQKRIGDVYGTALPPIWKVRAQYGDILLNFGLVKHSLDIYLKIQLWEEVVVCYTILQMREKAAEVIRQQLAIKPTVKLMCLLGDATDDVTCYEKAWEMSECRSHRPQRHWGQFLFAHKKYDECIPHFEKSLSINPIQANIWLRLGFAALQVENWQTAATAYRRYTTLEPDGFEAWNNLAQAYIKVGNKRSAHQAILEALKCNFDNWKIWENLLLVSTDISQFADVIRAYHKLIDLKEKYLNVEVLNILVSNVVNDSNDYEGNPSHKYLQKTRELLGRVTALHPNEGAVWELYAKLTPTLLLKAQRLQRAFRGYTQGSWDKDPKTCLHLLNICSELGDVVLEEEIDGTNTILNSVKLNLSSATNAIKKQDYDYCKDSLEEVSLKLDKIFEKIKMGSTASKTDGD